MFITSSVFSFVILARQKSGFFISRSGLDEMSDARTGPEPFFLSVTSIVSLSCNTNASFFILSNIS